MSDTEGGSTGRTRGRGAAGGSAPTGGIGTQLLRKLIEENDVEGFRSLPAMLLNEHEVVAHEFMGNHLRRHARLPSVTAMLENGHTLPMPSPDTVSYLRERLVDRQRYDLLVEGVVRQAVPAIQARNLDRAEEIVRELMVSLVQAQPSNDITTLSANTQQLWQNYRDAKFGHRIPAVSLGWDHFDFLADGGARAGDVIILAGRPNVGKSYLLYWILTRAWRAGNSLLVTSMEMRRERIEERIVALDTGLNPDAIRKGRLDRWAEEDLLAHLRGVDDRPPIYSLAGKYRKKVSDLNKAVAKCRPNAALVDAGYLMSPDGRVSDKKNERIADVIEQLKEGAEDNGIPYFVTVQLNREAPGKGSKSKVREMDLATLSGSDALGQIASVVIGARHGIAPYEKVRRVLDMGKNREGETGTIDINFLFRPQMDFSQLGIGHNGGPPLEEDENQAPLTDDAAADENTISRSDL